MSKVHTLHDAVEKFVHDGDHIAFGGFTTNRKPYAAVYEILRQRRKDFIAEGGPAGGDWDILIGAGRVKAFINCYTANSGFSNVSRRFKNAIEQGTILFEDYSQDALILMFAGAALGLPYVPVRVMLGSDLVDKWGISKEERQKIDKLPNEKYVLQDDPFNPGQKLVLLPTPKLDTAVIHVQKASPDGTCRIEGDEFHDVDIAIASKHCIVTCEEIISNEEIRRDPNLNKIPGFVVDAVVHAPHGAHPSQCYNYYDYDAQMLRDYDTASKTAEDFEKFITAWGYEPKTHEEYLNKLGAMRLIKTRAVPGLGYAPKVKK
jgi:glutaconate CoA-transferase subunit A